MYRQSVVLPGDQIAVFRFIEPDVINLEIVGPLPKFSGDRRRLLAFLAAYFEARREFLTKVAELTGLRIAVIDELPAGLEAIGEPVAPASE